MPTRILYEIGYRFPGTLLTVRENLPSVKGRSWVRCLCDCGTEKDIKAASLKDGNTKSCGCLQEEQQRTLTHTTHGNSGSALYGVWKNMIQRCTNPKNYRYSRYGGRGISVDKQWLESFEAFFSWAMVSGYRDGLTLERIDNDGNYDSKNCKWATKKEQSNNRKTNILVEHNGETKTLTQWCEIFNLRFHTIKNRYYRGDRGDVLFRPIRKISPRM